MDRAAAVTPTILALVCEAQRNSFYHRGGLQACEVPAAVEQLLREEFAAERQQAISEIRDEDAYAR
jgi:hypothetical protein